MTKSDQRSILWDFVMEFRAIIDIRMQSSNVAEWTKAQKRREALELSVRNILHLARGYLDAKIVIALEKLLRLLQDMHLDISCNEAIPLHSSKSERVRVQQSLERNVPLYR